MLDWIQLIIAAISALLLVYVPGFVCVFLVTKRAWISAGLGPAISSAIFGGGAIVLSKAGIDWNLWSALACAALAVLACFTLRALGLHMDRPRANSERAASAVAAHSPQQRRWARVFGALACTFALWIGVGPTLFTMPGPRAILQRWDALFHLSAITRIRETADGSSLTLGSLSYFDGRNSTYPAAFHDIASIIPVSSVPITLNGAVVALAVIPWAIGFACLARVLWPRHEWPMFASAILALLAPAAPYNEWAHLSPTPNLVGFAIFPGAIAFFVYAATSLARGAFTVRGMVSCSLVLGCGAVGVGLMHPNVLVSLSLMTAAISLVVLGGAVRRSPKRWPLLVVPVLCLVPTIGILALPGSSMTANYWGGLVVPGWQGLGEATLGLLTVWPMSIGVGIWALAWCGLWLSAKRGHWAFILCAAIAAILYYDAAIDSPLGLSSLWYRGQDRLSMLLTAAVIPLAVLGISQAKLWLRRLKAPRWLPVLALAGALVWSIASIAPRYDYAQLNLNLDMPGRNRYFDTEEWAMLQKVGPTLDHSKKVLASPFSGGAHLYSMSRQPVVIPIAGQVEDPSPKPLLEAAVNAGSDPASCALLEKNNIGYIYVDARYYNYRKVFDPLLRSRLEWGTPIASTDHSALYKVECNAAAAK